MSRVAGVLRALADLAPEGHVADRLDVTKTGDPFVWLGDNVNPWRVFAPQATMLNQRSREYIAKARPTRRLRAIDALHEEQHLLRAGWLWLSGAAVVSGRHRSFCLPLLARPIRLSEALTSYAVEGLGESRVAVPTDRRTAAIDWPWFGDYPPPAPPPLAAQILLNERQLPPPRRADAQQVALDARTEAWVDQVVAAAGLPSIDGIVGVGHPARRDLLAVAGTGLVVVVGTGLYVEREERLTASATALLEWADQRGVDQSAFAAVYGIGGPQASDPARTDVEFPQPLPLTDAQSEVVRRARTEPVTVVSGAPGNGKSHTVCAVAIDAVARDESVLVATPTPYAADVLGELLSRYPGPEPVLFGETEGRRRMVAALEVLTQRTVAEKELDHRRADVDRARAEHATAEAVVVGALERERRAERADRWPAARLADLRAAVPGAFAPGADLAELRRRLDRARDGGWWRRRRLRVLVGCAPIVGLEAVDEALEAAADTRAAVEVDLAGGTAIGAAWDVLLAAEARLADVEGRLVDGLARAERRWRGGGRRAVAALSRALPAGRSNRRDRLAAIDAGDLVRALPLWIGTIRDVEDLLPVRPGLFDLVVVDEAAQVDQLRAAGVLLRARRAVVVGDPRQLRHVSFIGDDDVAAALADAGVSDLADRLDVRRASLYDVAAGAAAVTFLDEHYRCAPHLIEFSAHRFYDDRVSVATRHPVNESADRIDVVRVTTVDDEVSTTVELIEALVAAGTVGVAAISPFRAHADAIEARLVERLEPEVIERHGVRAGTVHAAQGSERSHVVVALGLGADDPAGRWRFVQDPNLFNVLVTRARDRMTVVTALPADGVPRGIVRDYLQHAQAPPSAAVESPPGSPWAARLADELRRGGVTVRSSYPVGRWRVDICAGDGVDAVALDCAVHPDGANAHLARHRALLRAGWRVVDAFPSRWDGDVARAAVELATSFRVGAGPP